MSTYWIYLFYGLSFIVLGVALTFEQARRLDTRPPFSLHYLIAFAYLHGFHEWLLFALNHYPHLEFWHLLRQGILAASFLALGLFGTVGSLADSRRRSQRFAALFLYYFLLSVGVLWLPPGMRPGDGDQVIRLLVGVPGGLLASTSLVEAAAQTTSPFRRRALNAAAALLALYGLSQTFGTFALPVPLKPHLAIPVEVIRATLATGLAVALIMALHDLERERQAQYRHMQQARIAALEQAQRAQQAQQALQRELVRRIVATQEEERQRIARELHDETAQLLTAFRLNLAALKRHLADQPEAQQLVHTLDQLSNAMAQRLHHLVHRLRPAQLDDLGLLAALEVLAEEAQQTLGIQVHLHAQGQSRRLPATVETVAYRVIQEALTNVARHAQVDRAEVELTFTEAELHIRVSDQGIGFRVPTERSRAWQLGLAGMKERVEQIRGQLTIQSSPNQGTHIFVRLPAEPCQAAIYPQPGEEFDDSRHAG